MATHLANGGRRTGYSAFQSKRNAELKEANVVSSLRQEQIVMEWHLMSEDDRKNWNMQAANSTAARKVSGSLHSIDEAWIFLPKEAQEKWNAMARAIAV